MSKPRVSLVCNTEPINIELDCGIILLCIPHSAFVGNKARAIAARKIDALTEGEAVIDELGGEIVGMPNMTDLEGRYALGRSMFTEALAVLVVKDWQNVIDLNTKQELPLSDDNLRILLRSGDICDEFHQKYVETFHFFKLEGKG